jgi:hypothetical protein
MLLATYLFRSESLARYASTASHTSLPLPFSLRLIEQIQTVDIDIGDEAGVKQSVEGGNGILEAGVPR